MFSDLLDMTLSYIQYITLLLRLDPDDIPDFYTEPFKVLRYVVLDTSDDVGENQRYNNYLRINLPSWLPLDIRLQYVCIAVIGPMVVTTLGMLFVYGKPAYIWFVCALGTLFMFLFGFILLANVKHFTFPGSELPPKSTLGVLGGVGLPCFLLILAGGLLGMGRARLQLLRQDAREMERLIEEERQRRRDQRVTQQMVDREGIDLVAVAAEQVHARRDRDAIEHIDWGDVILQGLFVLVLLIGSLILLNAIRIPAIADMQTSTVFKVIGGVAMVVWGCVTFWWVLDFFKKGRQLQNTISDFASRRCLGLVVTVCNILYINVVTNFISIMYCVTLQCEAGTRTPYAASLFPSLLDGDGDSADVLAGSTVGCVGCNYHAYPQQCSAQWQSQLCTHTVHQRRLVYDPRVRCDDIDAFFKVSGSLIFAIYLIFLPYLQFYMAQYTVQVLKESYPLERRYYDIFTPSEIYFQKVLASQNNAAFAYRAYKPEFRFYRLSFLLQKVILGVVGCVMREGLSHDVAWAGMIFFLVVPLVALSCSLYLRPFSRQVEAYYFVAVQAMVSVCAVVCLIAQQIRSTDGGMPKGVWIVLLVLLVLVPVCTLVVGNAVTLQEERRWTELWQRRLVEGVTAAYEDPSQQQQQQNPLHRQQTQQPGTSEQGSRSAETHALSKANGNAARSYSSSGSSRSGSKSSSSTTSRSNSRSDGSLSRSQSSSSNSSNISGSTRGSGRTATKVPAHRLVRGQREEEEEGKGEGEAAAEMQSFRGGMPSGLVEVTDSGARDVPVRGAPETPGVVAAAAPTSLYPASFATTPLYAHTSSTNNNNASMSASLPSIRRRHNHTHSGEEEADSSSVLPLPPPPQHQPRVPSTAGFERKSSTLRRGAENSTAHSPHHATTANTSSPSFPSFSSSPQRQHTQRSSTKRGATAHHSSSNDNIHSNEDDDERSATLRGANATTTAFANLRKLRALPGLLQAETWGQSTRLVLGMAGRTIAAPFTHFYHQRGVVEDAAAVQCSVYRDEASETRGDGGTAVSPLYPRPLRAEQHEAWQEGKRSKNKKHTPKQQQHQQKPRRKKKKDKDSGSSEECGADTVSAEMEEIAIKVESGEEKDSSDTPVRTDATRWNRQEQEQQQQPRQQPAAQAGGVTTPLLSGTIHLPPFARTVNAVSPRHTHRAIPGVLSGTFSDVQQQQQQQQKPQKGTSGTSYSFSSALISPSLRARRTSLPSASASLSLSQQYHGLPIANPLTSGRPPLRATYSTSPGASMVLVSPTRQHSQTYNGNPLQAHNFGATTTMTTTTAVPATALMSPPAHVVVPSARELASPQHHQQQRRNSLHQQRQSLSAETHEEGSYGTLSAGAASHARSPAHSSRSYGLGSPTSAAPRAAATAAALNFPGEDAGEYGEDATETFIPALYFTEKERTRRQQQEQQQYPQRGHRGTTSLNSTSNQLTRSSDRFRLGRRRRASLASTTRESEEVRLPWKSHLNADPQPQQPAAHPLATQESLREAEAQQRDDAPLGPLLSSTLYLSHSGDYRTETELSTSVTVTGTTMTTAGATSASPARARAAPAARSSRSALATLKSALQFTWSWICNVDDDAARRRRNVLHFTDVYVRRQLCARRRRRAQEQPPQPFKFQQVNSASESNHNTANSTGVDNSSGDYYNYHGNKTTQGVGNAETSVGDILTLTPAQLRHCARKAFWGTPTDAMLGVVEVPGSMPPWGLYCHAPPPPLLQQSASAPHGLDKVGGDHDDDAQSSPRPQQRSMFSLQRQYYAQLAQEAAAQVKAATAAPLRTGSSLRPGSRGAIQSNMIRDPTNNSNIYEDDNGGGITSLTTSPVHTALSQQNTFRFPVPMQPLRAAAYAQQAAAVAAYRHDTAGAADLLPLDSELDAFAKALDEDEENEDGADGCSSGHDGLSNSLSGTSPARQRRASGTLHWLQQWGPVLTELLYEAAMDDSRRAAASSQEGVLLFDSEDELSGGRRGRRKEEKGKRRSGRGSVGSRTSSSGSDSSGSRTSSSSSTLSTSTTSVTPSSSPHHARRGSAERRRARRARKKAKSSSWCSWLSCLQCRSQRRRKRRAATAARSAQLHRASLEKRNSDPVNAAASRRASPTYALDSPLEHLSRRHSKRNVTEGGGGGGEIAYGPSTAPSLAGDAAPPLRRQQSTLLTLITGVGSAAQRRSAETSTRADARHSSSNNNSSHDSAKSDADSVELSATTRTKRHDPTTPLHTVAAAFSSEEEEVGNGRRSRHRRGQQQQRQQEHVDPLSQVPTAAASRRSSDSTCNAVREPQYAYDTSPAAPQDPLIQQLRCLHLVRQRLKESYWEHRDQLTAVQDYIDYEINETMRRVLTFLFIVVGTVATVSFTLAILGMLHTVNWRFISGVQRTNDDLRYELAGYASWTAFTENCCCMAATGLEAKYPYYALDVENWVCANGVTKERVRRDGYDGDVVSGYAVRPLCGMSFLNGCALTVDAAASTVTVTGCDADAVTAASILRW